MSLVNVNLDVKANEKKLTEIASLHSSSYQNSKPCPHIKFDHFLSFYNEGKAHKRKNVRQLLVFL